MVGLSKPDFRIFTVPELARVEIDTRDPRHPLVKIYLADDYVGDLCDDVNRLSADRLYLACDENTAINNPKLASFMEAAACHDYDGDGKYDADELMGAIDEALWRSQEAPEIFFRPKGPFAGFLMRFMPPQPDRHIIMGYGDIKRRFKTHDFVWSPFAVAAFIALMNLQTHFLPWTSYSVLSAYLDVAELVGISSGIATSIIIGLIIGRTIGRRKRNVVTTSWHTTGMLSKAATYEEQAFREGAENWSLRRRFMSCFIFGVIHLSNIIYPLASILPLALLGALFMWHYLRTYRKFKSRRAAVLAAAIEHRVYNKVALTSVVLWVLLYAGLNIFALFAGAICLEVAISSLRKKRQ